MSPKKKHSIIDELLGGSLFNETDSLFGNSPTSGYSVSVVQTPEGTKVKAKIGKDTDAKALQKQLQQQYPNAKIEIEGGKTTPLIREISTKTIRNKGKSEENNKTDN
jgi:hypothetical protein